MVCPAPLLSICTTLEALEFQVSPSAPERVRLGPLLKWPVAVHCRFTPDAADGGLQLTVMLCRVGTVSTVVSLAPPTLAVITVLPLLTVCAKPSVPELLLMVATLVFEDDHAAEDVTGCELPSE